MILIFLMNFFVLYSAYVFTFKIIGVKGIIDSLIAFFLLYFLQIILIGLALGATGKLFLHNVFFLNFLVALFLWGETRKRNFGCVDLNLKSALAVLLEQRLVLVAFSLIAGFGLAKICINLMNPPFGWDSLSYHFVFPVEWFKHGNLSTPITICDDPSTTYYPINGSLFFLWFMMPLKNVFIADLGQVPFFLLAFLSIFGILRKLEVNKELSFYAAALFTITPNVFKQIEIAYVDVMFAALFLSSLNFLLAFNRELDKKNLFLWAVSFGLFVGTKTSAIVYGIFPLAFFILILAASVKKLKVNRIIMYLAAFAAVVILVAGFSYIKNVIITGNPIYPVEINLLGKKIFNGVMPFASYRTKWASGEFSIKKLLFSEGMGPQFLIVLIPSLFLLLPNLLIKRRNALKRESMFFISLPFLLYASFVFFMPQLYVRYLYCFLGAGYIASMYLAHKVNFPIGVTRGIVALCLIASAFELSGHGELISSLLASLFIFLAARNLLKARLNFVSRIALFLVFFGAMYYSNIYYNKNEFKNYLQHTSFPKEDKEAWAWLNQNTTGNRIAYAGIPHVLPLYGTNFKNDVQYVSVNKTHPPKLHYFKNGRYLWQKDYMGMNKALQNPGNYREFPDYDAWVSNLKKERIDFLVIYTLHMIRNQNIFPFENDWAMAHPEVFEPVFNKNSVKIYRLFNN